MNIKSSLKLIFLVFSLSGCALFQTQHACSLKESRISENNSVVELLIYGNQDKPATKSIVILPPTGGTNYIDRSYGKLFCEKGYDVYILDKWTGMNVDSINLDLHQKYYSQTQKAIGLILNHINSPFIGLLGTSLGGLHASIALQTQTKLNAVFIIVGGTPIIDVIMKSDQKAMVSLRKARIEKFGFENEASLQEALNKEFFLEPLALGESHKKKSIGMSISAEDTTVPTANQIKLKEFLQPEKVITYENNHFWSIIKTWFLNSDDIVSFFDKNATL